MWAMKAGSDVGDVKNYRPISGLTFLSKVIEKIVAKQLVDYLDSNNLLPRFQSGFRRCHSTETAILRMLSDIYAAIDHGRVVLLALLDVSAAFDTVDHDILLERLSVSFGVTGPGTRMDPFVSVIPLAIRPSWKLFIAVVIDPIRGSSRFNSWASVVYHLYSGCRARGQVIWVRCAAIC